MINLGVFARERDTVQSGVVGLAKLSRLVLKVKLKKDNKIQLSNWAADTLNHKQQQYATLDAIVLLLLCQAQRAS